MVDRALEQHGARAPDARPPADAALARRIQQLVEHGARHSGLEALVRSRQRGNPEFDFLRPGGEGELYYEALKARAASGSAAEAASSTAPAPEVDDSSSQIGSPEKRRRR